MFKRIIATFTVLLLSNTATAASLNSAIKQCAAETNSLKRLVCFDKVAASIDNFPSTTIASAKTKNVAQAKSQPAPQAKSTASTSKGNFGIEAKKAAESYEAQQDGVIAKIALNGRNEATITLTNGQVWQQTEMSKVRLQVNDAVVIKRGVLNSFTLKKKGKKRKMKVKRTK